MSGETKCFNLALQKGNNNVQCNFTCTFDSKDCKHITVDSVKVGEQYNIWINFYQVFEAQYKTIEELNNALCNTEDNEVAQKLRKAIADEFVYKKDPDLKEVYNRSIDSIIDSLKKEVGNLLSAQQLGYAFLGDSLLHSCCIKGSKSSSRTDNAGDEENKFESDWVDKNAYEAVKKYAKGKGVKEFFVFLSALSNVRIGGEDGELVKTLEYKVARSLKPILKNRGINAFWWEESRLGRDVLISAKIASGLAFSSIFVGLAFDTVISLGDGDYNYVCLSGEREPNCFKYEVETFKKLQQGGGDAEKFLKLEESSDKDGGSSDKAKNSNKNVKFPQIRDLLFITYGKPSAYDEAHNAKLFDNYSDPIKSVQYDAGFDVAKKIEEVLGFIYDAIVSGKNNKNNCENYRRAYESWKKSPHYKKNVDNEKKRFCTLTEEDKSRITSGESGADDCVGFFEPFDPSESVWDGGHYGDEFLKGNSACKENIDMVPSDYFFEYAIIDDKGKNAKNHFLIFPERYNNEKGDFIWDLKVVVRDWNLSAVNNKEYPLAKLAKFKKIKCSIDGGGDVPPEEFQKKAGNYEGGGCAYKIKSNVFAKSEGYGGLTGTLTLFNDDSTKQEIFYFGINFIPKKIVYYDIDGKTLSVDKKINGTDVRVVNPHVGNTNDRIACLSGDMSVRPSQNNAALEEATLNSRLRFAGGSNKYYHLLPRPKEDNIKPADKSTKCIYCGRVQHNTDDGCPYNFIYDAAEYDERGEILSLKNKLNLANGKPYLAERDTPPPKANDSSKLALPTKPYDSMVVSLVGASTTGKSTFVSSLFGVKNGNIECSDIENSLKPYVGKTQFFNAKPNGFKNKYNSISDWRLKVGYSSANYGQFVERTATDDLATPHVPFVLRLEEIRNEKKRVAYLSFFDAPGGYFYENESCPFINKNDDYTMLFKSDCIILLVNGTPNGDEQTLDLCGVTSILQQINSYLDKFDQFRSSVVLAVVLCKFDAFVNEFDPCSYLRTAPPTACSTKFKDSERHKYIEMCSREVESYLKSKSNGGNFLKEVYNYEHYKFFAVSSVGREDSIFCKENETRTVFTTKPYNMENVLLWLMYQKNIIE